VHWQAPSVSHGGGSPWEELKKVLDPAGHRAHDPLVDLAPRLLWLA